MKTVFAAINAKYIHTNLALRSIGKYCREFSPVIKEYSINDNTDNIISSLYLEKADVIAFSCYIWNIEQVIYISKSLKKVCPNLCIVLGGHEVSYNCSEILEENSFIDFIIRGAGEKPMKSLLKAIKENDGFENVSSLVYRKEGEIAQNPLCENDDLNDYEFAYDESIDDFKGKIVYYESSRGCPFCCSYCLSGNNTKVNYLDTERVKEELMFFIEHNVPLVKFVDRTFNADRKRAKEIFEFIIKNSKNTCFHFELAGNLIDDETIDVLKNAPKGIIQFEIGVQSTNKETIKEIGRNIDFEKLSQKVSRLIALDNIHIHLDLIAGLPMENYDSFKNSFDEVLKLKPHVLQLGFLKMLKGSRIREEAEKWDYKFKDKAPYEVMENAFISFDEMIKLKYIEDLFEKYYNSGAFKRSMNFLFDKSTSAFSVFSEIYEYYKKNALFDRAISIEMRYDILNEIFDFPQFSDYVKADRLTNPKVKMPYESRIDFKERCFEFLKKEENLKKYLPHLAGEAARKIYKKLRFEEMLGGVYMYEEASGNLCEITQDF